VNPDDPDSITKAITWLKEHPDQAVEMGRNGRKAIENELNWEKESEKLVGFYKELLS
jgi:glycosyltransferase involved in cell wall biosynthesis